MPRIRIYEKDGLKLTYSPLNVDKMEEVQLDARKNLPAEDAPKEDRDAWVEKWNCGVAAAGLNIAAGKQDWDVPRIRGELDQVTIVELVDLILDATGLKVDRKRQESPMGESLAATSS